jgi:hypothetical protein
MEAPASLFPEEGLRCELANRLGDFIAGLKAESKRKSVLHEI